MLQKFPKTGAFFFLFFFKLQKVVGIIWAVHVGIEEFSVTMVVGPKMRWGTWEELILGGAVLRHGTDDWNVVASELRARTVYPNNFTPEACKARYEDLRKQYSGCK